MRKIILLFVFLFSCVVIVGQNKTSVEKSCFNFQIGTIGLWLNNEVRLSNEIALRTEIGLYTEIIQGVGFFMAPEITLEPRWYYNINKRASKKLDISNNSSNFFTIKTNFRSNIFEITTFDFDRAENSFSVIPKWGIRRNFDKNFNYELGLGLGYFRYINQKNINFGNSNGLIVDLHIRVGYNF